MHAPRTRVAIVAAIVAAIATVVALVGVSTPARAGGPAAGAGAGAMPAWSIVRRSNGRLEVVRGASGALLRPNAITPSGDRVLSVETDTPEHALASAGENDPMRPQQWGLDRTSFESAWPVTRGGGVTVAIVDSGVDAAHEDLGSVVLPGIDYIDRGRDGRYDAAGHGTHVAGVVAAQVNNARGIAGAAPEVRILPVRVLDADGGGVSSNVAAGIIWAVDHGARVVNLSLGGGPSPGIQIAMRYALGKGAVVLAAAGNNAATGNAPVYPGAYPEAIAVGAFAQDGSRSTFSNVSGYVDVSAPGTSILSLWSSSSNSYAVASGTSMATPFASAEAALIISENRALSAAAVTSILESTAIDAGAPGVDPEFGHGRINPAAAVLAATPRIPGYGTKGHGYWIVSPNGAVRAFGRSALYGDAVANAASGGASSIVAAARSKSGSGYWLAAASGAVFSFGDARYYGGMYGVRLNAPIVGMASTPSGRGYILLAADGGIFTFGDAVFYGSTGGMRLNARVLDLAMTASGRGYWFVAADGGVFSFGDAAFHGSTGAMRLAAPVMSIAAATDGRGYWLVASDGGIFAFGVPFEGSLPGLRLFGGTFAPTIRMRAISTNTGYYLLGLDGSIAAFGTARFFGSSAPGAAVDLILAP